MPISSNVAVTRMLKVRSSSLPLFMRCPQSVRGEVNISEWYPESDLGQAIHSIAASYVLDRPYDVERVAARTGVDAGELGFLVAQLVLAWNQLGPPVPEQGLGPSLAAEREWRPLTVSQELRYGPETGIFAVLQLTGTSDVVIDDDTAGGVVTVLDWKSGRRDADHREQLLGYCALALRATSASKAIAKAVWLRELEVESYSMDRITLDEWERRMRIQAQDLTYRPGPHCSWCPRRFSCDARQKMVEASVGMLEAVRPAGDAQLDLGGSRALAQLPAEDQIELYRRARDVMAMAERIVEEMRAIVAEKGPVEANGTRLEVVIENRRHVIPGLAWPVLQKHLTDAALADAVTVHITKAEDGAAENKPRGEGAKARRALSRALEEAGALTVSQARRLIERRST